MAEEDGNASDDSEPQKDSEPEADPYSVDNFPLSADTKKALAERGIKTLFEIQVRYGMVWYGMVLCIANLII